MSSFIHPGMLWGLALAAVPIVIHLLNRRRYQTVSWAAMEFLRRAFRKNQKRLRFENLLLLLIRTAAIVLLALALARPFLSGAIAGSVTTQTVHYTVVLDNSYSMGLNEGMGTPFDRAVKEAVNIVNSLAAEDSFTLYLTNDNFFGARPGITRTVLRDSREADKIRSVLGRIRVSSGRSGIVSVLSTVVDQLERKQPGQRVVLLTDLQRAAWETGANASGGDEELSGGERTIRDLLEEIERRGAALSLIDVGADDPANVAIESLAPEKARALVAGNPERFRARVVNYGRRPVAVDVRWSVDGQHKGSTRVELPGAGLVGDPGTRVTEFTFPRLDDGPHSFAAELPTDMLPADDRRWFSALVRERIRILAVDGDPDGSSGFTRETRFLEPAIGQQKDRIQLEVVDPLGFVPLDLSNFDMVILANVERVREERVAALEEFVRRGGALMVFLGNLVEPEIANQSLGREGAGLLPGVLDPKPVMLDRDESFVRISIDAPPHPLFDKLLATEEFRSMWEALEPKVWGYYRVTPWTDDPTVTVLLRYTDAERSPALIERRFGKGLVCLWTTAADADWSQFPSPFSFSIPLLHEMVYYMTRPDVSEANLLPFGTYMRDLPERVTDIQVATPAGGKVKVEPVVLDEEGRKRRLEFRDTEGPGVYRVSYNVRGASAIDARTFRDTGQFSVNVDAREGDVRRLSRAEVTERYATANLRYAQTFSGRIDAEKQRPEGEIWKGLLAAVLLLLLVEILIARRFGDASRRLAGKAAA